MLIVKSTLSLNSIAPDRAATMTPKDLPKAVRAAGWERVLLADERTMAGAVAFLDGCAEAGVVGSVGLQLSRLEARGGRMGVILMPLTQDALRGLLRLAGPLAKAARMVDVLRTIPPSNGPREMVAFLLPGPGFVVQEGVAEELRREFLARAVNPAVGFVTVNGEELAKAPRADALALAAMTLPVARLVEGLTKKPLDETLSNGLASYAEDAVGARGIPAPERRPQSFADGSIPKAAAVLARRSLAADNATGAFARIQPMLASAKATLPKRIGLGPGESADGILVAKARDGLERKIALGRLQDPAAARERLEYELGVIKTLGFSNYFLLKLEAIGFARSRGIPVGPGRGSAAGSMVTFAIGITNIDPLRYKLLFERFINPERVSLPDIDSDFCPHRRKEVLDHLVEKYGHAHVAGIATYGTTGPRGAIRKAATLLKTPGAGNRAVAMIKSHDDKEEEVKLNNLDKVDDLEVREIGRLAKFMNGLAGNAGVHAAGVVLADDPIAETAPLNPELSDDGLNVVQYDMKSTEASGLVKFDFLGLETLTIIDHAVKALAAEGTHVDVEAIPMDDEPTYEMLRRGRTLTVFQLERGGITSACRDIVVSEFEDLVALVALYRPGPMHNIELYANRKHGRAPVEYLHPSLEEILRDTYGIIIYQEQIMAMAQAFAGYTMPQADVLRRAIGKKNAKDVEAEREPFIERSVANGRDPEDAQRLFEFILPFAQYGFNRSHAAAYAMITYQTAYLKRNHTAAWLAACATYSESAEKRARIVGEAALKWGIKILPPDVNRSERGFAGVRRDGLPCMMLPLECVQGVGRVAAAEAIAEREANGPFKNFTDFTSRVSSFNRNQIENLVWAGVFDSLSKEPPTISRPYFADLAQTAVIASSHSRRAQADQIGLFAMADIQPERDPPNRTRPVTPEEAALRQDKALQDLLHHERRTIASTRWRRQVEALPMLRKAYAMAKKIKCETMGILVSQGERMMPEKDGTLRRVLHLTVEDEEGRQQFDVSADCAVGAEVADAKGRPVRLTLQASTAFSFISGSPEVTSVHVYRDPLAEPREYPALVVGQELGDELRRQIRGVLRDLATTEGGDDARGRAVKAARATRDAAGRRRATHLLVVPPSREIEIFALPAEAKGMDLSGLMDEIPEVVSVLD